MISTLMGIIQREWRGYFANPMGVLFVVIFVGLTNALAFFVGGFFEREIADLEPFFQFHPWVFLLLIPAMGMRLWAEEYRTGTAELILTLPVSTAAWVVGKFLAAWLLVGLALVLCFPMWISVNVLGDPDNGVIATGFLASWLLSGGFLAVSACVSASTENQISAFIGGGAICLSLLLLGLPGVLQVFSGLLSPEWLDRVAQLGILKHYSEMARGVMDLGDLIYFFILIGTGLVGNWLLVELRKVPR
jgi:ABC-2 type transport system permease protein